MSGYYNNPDHEENFEDNSGKGLRAQLEAALAKIEDLTQKLDSDNAAKQTQTATELLKGKGIDPAVIELVPEGANPVEWVEKYSHLLGAKGTEMDETVIDQPEVQMADDDDAALVAEREARTAMSDAAASGSPSNVVSNDLIEQMAKINDEGELLAFFKSHGMS